MTNYIATVLDTTGIQSYIFSSNRLRENVGASCLVEQVTKNWVKGSLEKLNGQIYYPGETADQPDERPYIEKDNLSAEVVYAAGGNTVILFKSKQLAEDFTKDLSTKVLRKAPGINLVIAHRPFEWNEEQTQNLHRIVDSLIKNEIERKKNERPHSVPLLGLGVTADCNSTRLVAIGKSNEFGAPKDSSYLVSREVKYKLLAVKRNEQPKRQDEAARNANEVLKDFFSDVLPDHFDFPLDVDDLGRSRDESSYVAVVHADGNSMGDRFKNCGKDSPNREYITKIRELSWSVNQAGINALKAIVKTLIDPQNLVTEDGRAVLRSIDSQKRENGRIELKQKGDKIYLPFRPLVYGGDDVTFVCDGRLGLTLAALYLKAFERKAADGEWLTACAGVSIAKAHYPFARSYELSSQLCSEAKKLVRQSDDGFSALDWHVAASGLSGTLQEIRQREYAVPEGRLNIRPLQIRQQENDWLNWDIYQNAINLLNVSDELRERRNKVISLREELRRGRKATEKFLTLNPSLQANLPILSHADPQLQTCGWTDITLQGEGVSVCGYFDAIETMEFHLPLVEVI
jgi:CRISPR/Cas system-associated protein Cas10 (large subunit of type III CRISPR-Cas system)